MNLGIDGINHITFAVEDIGKSTEFYKTAFGAKVLAKGKNLSYFDIAGVWIALNVEKDILSKDRQKTYTHVAFSMSEENQEHFIKHLESNGIDYTKGRPRNIREGQSVYVRDYDGHLFEFHSKNINDRLNYYREERDDIKVKY